MRLAARRNVQDRVAPATPHRVAAGLIPSSFASTVARHVRVPNSGNLGRGVGHFLRPLTLPYELGRATVESPGAVAKSSLRTGVESITGIPQAAKQIVSDVQQHGLAKGVGHSLAAIAKDYERRYGPILTDPARFRQQVKSDYGLTPFVFDASVLGGGAGRVAGALARSGPAGRAAAALTRLADRHPSAARPAAAARLLHGASKGERPALRYSAGERGVRSQEVSRNLFKAVGQRGLDRSRRRAFEKQAGRAGVRVDRRTNRLIGTETGGGRFTALRPGPGEVVPKTTGVAGRSLRELPGLEKFTGRAPREIGGRQSVTRVRLLPARAAALEKINRRIEKLSPEEGNALKYMLQLGVKPDEAGLRQLTRRLAQMQEGRARKGIERVTPVLADTNDEVRLLRAITQEPERYLTPKAREIANELRDLQLKHAARDPGLATDQELIRRVTPQGALLGVTRGPDVEHFRGVLRKLEAKTQTPGLAAHADEIASLPPAERAAAARKLKKAAKKDRKAAERDVASTLRTVAVEREKLQTREKLGPDAGNPVFNAHQFAQAEARMEHAKHAAAAADDALKGARQSEQALRRSSRRRARRSTCGSRTPRRSPRRSTPPLRTRGWRTRPTGRRAPGRRTARRSRRPAGG
jgi:hypothetical protein